MEGWKWGKMWKEAEKIGLFSVLHIYASLSSTDVLVVQTISSPGLPQSRLGCRSQASVTQLPRIFLGWKNTIPNYLNSILQPSAFCFSSRLMLPPRSSAVWPYSRYFVPTRMVQRLHVSSEPMICLILGDLEYIRYPWKTRLYYSFYSSFDQ